MVVVLLLDARAAEQLGEACPGIDVGLGGLADVTDDVGSETPQGVDAHRLRLNAHSGEVFDVLNEKDGLFVGQLLDYGDLLSA